MDTTTTTAQHSQTETEWRLLMTTPGFEGEKCSHERMVCAPTLTREPDGTMRAAFAPERDSYHAADDYDPWMTIRDVTRVPAAGLVVLTTTAGDVILMSEDEYHSQV